ncbi:hypothetical protein [Desulfitobacterium metallireducens]|uniref:Uncharacterized protein n=1 Tax=Desulfitobacterium metallireducens DSM 15288 TaxID=871968 RepID=W0EG73_9FIRM|nr:hypothetical protein [Desulfitobacterium metallireducens]AHF08523.1 hypothetical protein DESME_06755 [Desulfitobacterium metallireducens DSM 15288]
MSLLYRILGFAAFLVILASTATFAFGLLVVGVVVLSGVGLYRYYRLKKNFKNGKIRSKSKGYSSGEIIDMPVEERNERKRV